MLSDEWLSRYGLLENFNASVTRTRTRTRTRTGTGTGTGTGTWTTVVTAIALCTSCSRANDFCGLRLIRIFIIHGQIQVNHNALYMDSNLTLNASISYIT